MSCFQRRSEWYSGLGLGLGQQISNVFLLEEKHCNPKSSFSNVFVLEEKHCNPKSPFSNVFLLEEKHCIPQTLYSSKLVPIRMQSSTAREAACASDSENFHELDSENVNAARVNFSMQM